MFAQMAFACGPIEDTYALKNQFAPDNTLKVVKDIKKYGFALEAYSATEKNDGSKTRSGTSRGDFSLKNRVAYIEDKENECRFIFSFKKKRTVKIHQAGSCLTFGDAVDATGLYEKE